MAQLNSFDEVRLYLDRCINHWRDRYDEANEEDNEEYQKQADNYIDAFQSVRSSLFGETL